MNKPNRFYSNECRRMRSSITVGIMITQFVSCADIPADYFIALCDIFGVTITDRCNYDLTNYVVSIDNQGNIKHHKPNGYYIMDEVHEAGKQLLSKITKPS